jgi:hypothetical protein
MTIEHLTLCLGVHSDFIPHFEPGSLWLPSAGNALYKTSENGTIKAIGEDLTCKRPTCLIQAHNRISEGFYRYSMMDTMDSRDFRVRVWFRHNLVDRSSTYIIHNFPDELKIQLRESIASRVRLSGYQALLSMSTDCLITKLVANSWQSRIYRAFTKLLDYVRFLTAITDQVY